MPDDFHESIHDEIQRRIKAVTPVSGTTPSEEDASLLSELLADRNLLREHWRISPRGTTDFSQPANAKACGKPQPCSHTLDLAEKYGLC